VKGLSNTRTVMARALMYAFLALVAAATLAPLATMTLAAFKGNMELLNGGGFALPHELKWSNFSRAWMQGHFSTYFFNSVLVTLAVVALGLFFSVLCSYAINIIEVPLSRFWLGLFLVGIIFPEISMMFPSYFNLRALHLLNTYWALILPQTALSIAFGTVFLMPAMKAMPKDLLENAHLDGCSDLEVLRFVALPLLKPALGALSVLFFLWTWNDFVIPNTLVSSDSLKTLPIGLMNYKQRYTTEIPLVAAGTLIVTVPVVFFYLVFQRQIIRGMTAGALKE
jgi:raffinose/stachyose/melibiose transport system permease protein